VLFSGWTACAFAVPLTDPEVPVTLTAPSPAAGNTAQPASQKPGQYDTLAQPSAAFVCPRHAAEASAIECFLEAVEHLYTVCRQVKSIELLEFGFANAEEGLNGLKSEFCRRKQKTSLPQYFDAALREAQAMSSCEAARTLNDLYMIWSATMVGLRPYLNETEADYQQRIAVPYLAFAAYRQQVREALANAGQWPVQHCPSLVVFTP
jgi:hypothetical protein